MTVPALLLCLSLAAAPLLVQAPLTGTAQAQSRAPTPSAPAPKAAAASPTSAVLPASGPAVTPTPDSPKVIESAVAPPPFSSLTPGEAFLLGYRHLTGDTVPRDATKAAVLFLQAATAGEPQAQYQLGVLFMDGLGMPKDPLWAYYWLNLAARSPGLSEDVRAQARGRLQSLQGELTADQKRRLGIK